MNTLMVNRLKSSEGSSTWVMCYGQSNLAHLMRQKILLCFHCSNNPLFKRQSSSRHILLLSPSYLFGSTLVVCSYTPSRSNHRTLYSTRHNVFRGYHRLVYGLN